MNFNKTTMICTLLLISSFLLGQNTKTSYNSFKNGILTKVIEYPLPMINISPKTRNIPKIQKMIINGEESFYYIIKSNNTKTESVNLPELIEVIDRLKNEFVIDETSAQDNLLNVYITNDDFKIGYRISYNKLNWFFGNDVATTIDGITEIQSSFKLALTKIDSLRNR